MSEEPEDDRLSEPIQKARVMTLRMASALNSLKHDPTAKAHLSKRGGARIGNTALDKRVYYRLVLAGYIAFGQMKKKPPGPGSIAVMLEKIRSAMAECTEPEDKCYEALVSEADGWRMRLEEIEGDEDS